MMDTKAIPPSHLSEAELVWAVYQRLLTVEGLRVKREVPVLGRCVDLVYLRSNRVYSVEFKLQNWRRGLRQARDHRLGADYAFICMPERKVSAVMREELREAGVGLLFYDESGDWPFRKVVPAPKSTEIWSVARATLRRTLLSDEDAGG